MNIAILGFVMPYITKEHKVIADIGCGDLYFSSILCERFNGRVFAVDTGFTDLSSDSDKIIKMGSIDHLEDNSVDIAILMDVLEHVEEPKEFLATLLAK